MTLKVQAYTQIIQKYKSIQQLKTITNQKNASKLMDNYKIFSKLSFKMPIQVFIAKRKNKQKIRESQIFAMLFLVLTKNLNSAKIKNIDFNIYISKFKNLKKNIKNISMNSNIKISLGYNARLSSKNIEYLIKSQRPRENALSSEYLVESWSSTRFYSFLKIV